MADDAAYALFLFVGLAAVLALNSKIYHYLRSEFAMIQIDTRLKEMNKQINIALLLQALVPCVTEIVPGCFISLQLVVGTTCRAACYAMLCVSSWMPVLNPLMALLFIRPYRTVVLTACGCLVGCSSMSRSRVGYSSEGGVDLGGHDGSGKVDDAPAHGESIPRGVGDSNRRRNLSAPLHLIPHGD